MLTEAQLGIAIAAVLLAAVGVGVLLHWLLARLGGAGAGDSARLERLNERLQAAERAREAAERARQEAEARLAERERQAETRPAAGESRPDQAAREREAALERELAEARSDLEAMRVGLANARRRIYALEAELEQLVGKSR